MAQEPKPSPSKTPPAFETRIYKVPPGFLFGGGSDRKPAAGVRLILHTGNATQYDASGYLKNAGVAFPDGAVAVFEKETSLLVVHNTPANLEIVDEIVSPPMAVEGLEVELSAVECTFPKGRNVLQAITYPEIQRLPAKSVKLVDRVSAVGKSGQRFVLHNRVAPATASGGPSAYENTEFAPGETGTEAEVEAVMDANGMFFNLEIAYHLRTPAAPDGKTLREINFYTGFSARNDFPEILNTAAVPEHEGTFIVIIARVRVTDLSEKNEGSKPAKDDASSQKQPSPQ